QGFQGQASEVARHQLVDALDDQGTPRPKRSDGIVVHSLSVFSCARMRSRIRGNLHRAPVDDANFESQRIKTLTASKVHAVSVFRIAVVRIDAASLAEEVIHNPIAPTIVVEIVHVAMRLEVRRRYVFGRHDGALADADRAVAALAGFDFFAAKREA